MTLPDFHLNARLEDELARLHAAGLVRRRRVLDSASVPRVRVEGRDLLAFASNDYLGLAAHPELVEALAAGAREYGVGAGASHLVNGHLRPHEMLEARLAALTGFPAALTFSSGYLANLAVTPTLAAGRADAIFADRLNHASLIDAAQLSRAQHHRYPHGDLAALEKQLAASTAQTKVIVTDAVFSMDGDLAPLPELFALAERFDAWLVVDDAHGFGVLGQNGAGSLAHCGLPAHPRIVLMGTLGKAAGVGGAFVAGSECLIDYLVNKARSYIFTTAQPPALASALLKSVELIAAGAARRAHLQALIRQLRAGVAGLPWRLLASETAIQPLLVGENMAALALSRRLWENGLWVAAIRPPTVPQGTARLRISLSAAHTEADVARLVDALHAAALQEN
ncbi:MAG: 8-amino-7-oxononanoate synthase [Zoogloeaceae bacterium]|jgi:8-amino-7-oxononanoate synthase|nr:8-amino-7-oxononanoate synthase [Zoogloeaceae bacterium]